MYVIEGFFWRYHVNAERLSIFLSIKKTRSEQISDNAVLRYLEKDGQLFCAPFNREGLGSTSKTDDVTKGRKDLDPHGRLRAVQGRMG